MTKSLFTGLLLGSLIGVVLAVSGIGLFTVKGIVIVSAILAYSTVDRIARNYQLTATYEITK